MMIIATLQQFLDPFQDVILPIGDWVEVGVRWLVDNYRGVFQAIRVPINLVLAAIESFLLAIPSLIFVLLAPLLIWQLTNRGLALACFGGLLLLGSLGAWQESMTTLSLVLTAVAFCTLIGIPVGILSATNDRFEGILRPILDAMQTLPAFVYLVPVVMLFGIGAVPGVIVTLVFAVPPLIRLTNLGIRQVQEEAVEAAEAFGSTPNQLLWEVQVPLAMPTILAGLNQSLMLSLSMVVIASLIGVGGLGQMVNRGIGRLDVSLAATGGISIVILAIVLDRVTQEMGQPKGIPFHKRGPLGMLLKWVKSTDAVSEPSVQQ
jgi:glycine betaine/proline transport system permease protein